MERQTQKNGFVSKKENPFRVFYKHLVAGITYMVPVVVAGGIIFAISFLIDTCAGVNPASLPKGEVFGQVTKAAKIFNQLGRIGLSLIFPILSCFIAYSIAGKRAIAPGIIGGMAIAGSFSILYLVQTGQVTPLQDLTTTSELIKYATNSSSGFIGGLAAGFAAGYLTLFFGNILKKMKGSWSIFRDFMLIPLIVTLIVGMFMFFFNVPITFLNFGIGKGLTNIANFANGALALLVAALVAGLMCIDMGGPINKAAHFFCIDRIMAAAVGSTEMLIAQKFMAANIVGIMVPPVAIAISTWLFPTKYTKEERDPSIGNCLIGFCGITEPAIPYLAKDPIRIILSCVLGAMVGGIVSFQWGFACIAPEGGIFSMITAGATFYKGIVATIAGAVFAALLLGISKKNADPELAKIGKWKGLAFSNGIGFPSAANTVEEKVILENLYKDAKVRLDRKLEHKRGKVDAATYKKLWDKNIAKKAELDKELATKLMKLDQRFAAYKAKLARKAAKKHSKRKAEKPVITLNTKTATDKKQAIHTSNRKVSKKSKKSDLII